MLDNFRALKFYEFQFTPHSTVCPLSLPPSPPLGTFAVVCLMTGKVVGMLATDPEDAAALAADAVAGANATATYSPSQIAALVAFAVGVWEVGPWVSRSVMMGPIFDSPGWSPMDLTYRVLLQ